MNEEMKLREKIKAFTTVPLFPEECNRNYMKNDGLNKDQVFCFKIMNQVYAYGSVLNCSLTDCWDNWYDGAIVIEVYDFFTRGIDADEFLNSKKKILFEPIITKLTFFKKGILIPLEVYQKSNTSYGFYRKKLNVNTNVFERINKVYNEYGKETNSNRVYISSYGLTTNIGLFHEVFSKILDRHSLMVSGENKYNEFKKFILSK